MSNFTYSIEICSEQNTGQVYQLNRNEVVVGRGNVDISIDNPTLSSNHCLFRNNGSQLTVMDLQSRNGTLVNDQRILHETALTSGDIVTLGEVSFRVTAAITKERLTSEEKQKGQSITRKFLDRLPRGTNIKSSYEKTSRNMLLLMVLLSWLILLAPLYFIMQDNITKARVERGISLVTALAAANTEAMRQGRQIMVDTSIIDREPGLSLVCILTNDGTAWAPEEYLNKRVTDSFGKNAVDAEQLLIQDRGNGILDISLPIKYYDFNNGQTIKLGVARINYNIKTAGTGPPRLWVILLCSGVFLFIALFCIRKINQTVKKDILAFQEDCEDLIKGNTSVLKEKYSPVFNELTITINRMLRKLGSPQNSQTQSDIKAKSDELAGMVSTLGQPALLLNSINVIVGSSPRTHELLSLQPEHINYKSILEVQCSKDFYSQLLEFACEATQSQVKTSRTLTSHTDGNILLTAHPIATGYSLLLFSEEAHAMA